jgi:hypothetical protein
LFCFVWHVAVAPLARAGVWSRPRAGHLCLCQFWVRQCLSWRVAAAGGAVRGVRGRYAQCQRRQRLLVGTLTFPLLRLRRAPAVFEAGHPAAFEVSSAILRRQAGDRVASKVVNVGPVGVARLPGRVPRMVVCVCVGVCVCGCADVHGQGAHLRVMG